MVGIQGSYAAKAVAKQADNSNKINKIIEQKKEASFYIKNRNAFNPHTIIKTAEEIRNRM